jgi:hypothetical protein
MRSRDDEDEDAMDWTPTTSSPVRSEQALRGSLPPARRAGDTTTGLETLLERTNIIDSSELGKHGFLDQRKGRECRDYAHVVMDVGTSTSAFAGGSLGRRDALPLL